jgi:hypothetical protein
MDNVKHFRELQGCLPPLASINLMKGEYVMTKIELLEKYKDQAYYNLMCYSKNLAMTIPREEYVKEWNEAQEEVDLIREITKDLSIKENQENKLAALEGSVQAQPISREDARRNLLQVIFSH